MPSKVVLEQKQGLVAELKEKLEGSIAGVLVDYKGINVASDTKLRKELRQADVDYKVVKNTLLRFAANEVGFDGLSGVLEGTTALAVSKTDPVAAARILCKFEETSKGKFTVKAGFVDGKVLSADEVSALAKLPSKEELIARVLAGFNAPITGFVNVLNGNMRGLVVALNAIAEQKAS